MTPTFSFTDYVAACDLCGSGQLSTVSAAANVVQCAACGYRFVSPRPSQIEIANSYSQPDFYDSWINEESGRIRMWTKRLGVVRRAGEAIRVLDIGAGIGTFLALARDQLDWEVVGTEISKSAVQFAREHYGLELLLGPVEEAQLALQSFDLITLWHVLEHVPHPARTLQLCYQLLANSGHLAIAVPNDDEARAWLVRAKARLLRVEPPPRYERLMPHEEVHLSHFKSEVLMKALRSHGFRVELVTVDDQYAKPSLRSETLVSSYRIIQRVTRLNFGQATLVLARKEAS